MKVFYLPGAYDGCYYYRGYLPGLYTKQTIMTGFKSRGYDDKELHRKCMDADVIVIQRPNEPVRHGMAIELKRMGKKIVFDNDDTYLPDKGVPLSMLKSDKQREVAIQMNNYLYDILKIADMAIATTEFLADEFRAINPNVFVLPNCIDPMDEEPKRENDTGKYRIGFIGSVTSNDDYLHIKEDIMKLDERGDVTIVVFGIKQRSGVILGAYNEDHEFWSTLKNVEWQSYVPITEYYHTIAKLKLDLAIIPRKDSYFNRCKSNLKFLECSLLRIPVIAQGYEDGLSPYQVNPEDKDHLELVMPNENWYDRIVSLLEDKEKRTKMANEAHDYVVRNYNIKNNAQKWEEAIKTIWKQEK